MPTATAPVRGPSRDLRVIRARQLVNLLTLATPAALVLAVSGRARLRRGPHGLILATGYPARFPAPRAPAVTIGDVVLLRRDDARVDASRAMLAHEARHAAQWACWGGPVGFLPAYALACGWSWWRTRSFAVGNPFERRAGLEDGGYGRRPASTQPSPSCPRGRVSPRSPGRARR